MPVPSTAPTIATERLDLVAMPLGLMKALDSGDRALISALADFEIPSGFPEPDEQVLRFRIGDLARDPGSQRWLVRAIVLREPARVMIGHIGFHGPPDGDGRAEIGYTIFSSYRRRGYALEAIEAMFAWAQKEEGIARFRAAVGPDNVPSLRLVEKLGFRQIGTQIDEIDGEELVFELDRVSPPPGRSHGPDFRGAS